MPPIGEKRPRWLMGCKCGARVKARPLGGIYCLFKAICGDLRPWEAQSGGVRPNRNSGRPAPVMVIETGLLRQPDLGACERIRSAKSALPRRGIWADRSPARDRDAQTASAARNGSIA